MNTVHYVAQLSQNKPELAQLSQNIRIGTAILLLRLYYYTVYYSNIGKSAFYHLILCRVANKILSSPVLYVYAIHSCDEYNE